MKTLVAQVRHEGSPVNGSRFIVTASSVSSETEAKSLLQRVSGEMTDASHHCWAWRLAKPAIERADDLESLAALMADHTSGGVQLPSRVEE